MLKFFKQFLIYGLSSVLAKIAAVFLMPFYTKVLSKEEYGVMALLLACKGIIDLVSNLNIHSGISREYYEDGINKTKLISTGFWSILSSTLLIFSFILIFRNFWVQNVLHIKGYETAFIVMAFTVPSGSLLSYFSILTRYKHKAVSYSIGITVQLFIQISLSIYFVLILKIGVIGVFIAILIGGWAGVIYFAILNREHLGFYFEKSLFKKALRFAVPTLPAILAGWIDNSAGQILIGKNVSLKELGVYSIALQLVSIFTLIAVALNNVWYPYVFENYKKDNFKKDVTRLYKLLLLFLMFLTFNLSILSKEIILLLANPSYLNASRYFILLCFPACVYLLLPFVSVAVDLSRETKYLSYSFVAGSVVNLLLLLWLLPKLGIIIVPICLAVSRIVNYTILYLYAKKRIEINYSNLLLLIFAFVIACCYLLTQFYNQQHLFILLGVTNILFLYLSNKRYGWVSLIRMKLATLKKK